MDTNLNDRLQLQIVADLDSFRKNSRSRLPGVLWGACGGQSTRLIVRLTTDPPNGTVQILPDLYYDVCSSQNINKNDYAQCNHWHPVSDGEEVVVVGAYVFKARWPDGRSMTSRKDFARVPDTTKQWIIRYQGN